MNEVMNVKMKWPLRPVCTFYFSHRRKSKTITISQRHNAIRSRGSRSWFLTTRAIFEMNLEKIINKKRVCKRAFSIQRFRGKNLSGGPI